MARFKLILEYAGTRYSGWQVQKNARTVQGEIQRAVEGATLARGFELYGSSRTDAGVHARAQVAHLDIDTALPPETLRRRINDELPADINVLAIEQVPRRFHARHDARGRSYLYQVSRRRTAFAKPFVWWVRDELDLARMREAAARFVGFHDFRSFSDDDPGLTSTKVQLDTLAIGEDGDLIVFRVSGSHFIWKMVRRLVGVLVEVGRGGLTPDEAAALLVETSPLPARLTAPASGLFLDRVIYDDQAATATPRPAVIVETYRQAPPAGASRGAATAGSSGARTTRGRRRRAR